MSQLTLENIAEAVKEVGRTVDRRLDVFEEKVEQNLSAFEAKVERKLGTLEHTMDQKLGMVNADIADIYGRLGTFEDAMDQKLSTLSGHLGTLEEAVNQQSVLIEHMDGRLDGLAEAIQLVNGNITTLATQNDLREVRYDIKTIKVAVRATNDDLWRQNS